MAVIVSDASRQIDNALNLVPTTDAELEECLASPYWRIFGGFLYRITARGDFGEATSIPFRPNAAQRKFIESLWYRNLILKARQLGFSTAVAILWLDHALFVRDQRCGIIAQDREAAEVLFRDKVKFAYENLPAVIRARFPLASDSRSELLFSHNNSSIRVATSMRSGTIHRLHVSEYGKICAQYPDKAEEVMTGSIPAVPQDGIVVIESTAEGASGEFHEMVQRARVLMSGSAKETQRDYRLHFFPWWSEPRYRMDSSALHVTPADHEYFDEIEAESGGKIDAEQRAWYVATRAADFVGREERMWQEYPSTVDEAFQQSTKGGYYTKSLAELVSRGAITAVPVLDAPVSTFWDIGNSDGCAIWFAQSLRGEDRFIGYYEAHEEDLRHYAKALQDAGHVYDTHYVPHDAGHRRLSDFNRSTLEMLEQLLPGQRFVVVPRITTLQSGIEATRKHLRSAWFDAEGCRAGIERLRGYRKSYNRSERRYTDQPDKSNGCSEAADALRQWAQAREAGLYTPWNSGSRIDYAEPPAPDWRI